MMKTLEATTQLGGFNQHLLMRHYNKHFPYSGPQWHKDGAINTIFYSVQTRDVINTIEIIVGTNTLPTDVYAIVYKSGLNISKVLQDRFHERGIPINIWSNNSQE